MQARHLDRRRYFMEEASTTEKYFIPYLSNFVATRGVNVLEVGCGEGGNLLPFARRACHVTGVDMSELRIRQAQTYFKEENATAEFVCSDILNYDCCGRSFDIIIMHDVVEHVPDKAALLSNSASCWLLMVWCLWLFRPGRCLSAVISRLPAAVCCRACLLSIFCLALFMSVYSDFWRR